MLHLDADTLAYYKESPFLKRVDFSEVWVPTLAQHIQDELSKAEKASPEVEALTFYLYNHAFSLVSSKVDKYEPLGDYLPVVTGYLRQSSYIFKRLMYYMVLIITRESRHLHSSKKVYAELEHEFGGAFMEFHHRIHTQSSHEAVSSFVNYAPEMPLGAYVKGLTTLFCKGKFSSGYGGMAWNAVAKVLGAMVCGETTPEMMVDTAWTLCHNNGPIFNKGMFYHNYTSELKKILDVQRSGQIPQYLDSYKTVYSEHVIGFPLLKTILPQEMSGYVDWFKVEALGALLSYPSEKAKQVELYGDPNEKPGIFYPKKIWVSEHDYAETYERKAA